MYTSGGSRNFRSVWGFFVPLIWRRHHYRWRTANFDQCSTIMAIEQLGFFGVPQLLWHGGHFRGGSETLTWELDLERGWRIRNLELARYDEVWLTSEFELTFLHLIHVCESVHVRLNNGNNACTPCTNQNELMSPTIQICWFGSHILFMSTERLRKIYTINYQFGHSEQFVYSMVNLEILANSFINRVFKASACLSLQKKKKLGGGGGRTKPTYSPPPGPGVYFIMVMLVMANTVLLKNEN